MSESEPKQNQVERLRAEVRALEENITSLRKGLGLGDDPIDYSDTAAVQAEITASQRRQAELIKTSKPEVIQLAKGSRRGEVRSESEKIIPSLEIDQIDPHHAIKTEIQSLEQQIAFLLSPEGIREAFENGMKPLEDESGRLQKSIAASQERQREMLDNHKKFLKEHETRLQQLRRSFALVQIGKKEGDILTQDEELRVLHLIYMKLKEETRASNSLNAEEKQNKLTALAREFERQIRSLLKEQETPETQVVATRSDSGSVKGSVKSRVLTLEEERLEQTRAAIVAEQEKGRKIIADSNLFQRELKIQAEGNLPWSTFFERMQEKYPDLSPDLMDLVKQGANKWREIEDILSKMQKRRDEKFSRLGQLLFQGGLKFIETGRSISPDNFEDADRSEIRLRRAKEDFDEGLEKIKRNPQLSEAEKNIESEKLLDIFSMIANSS